MTSKLMKIGGNLSYRGKGLGAGSDAPLENGRSPRTSLGLLNGL
jgi:hypothetical protein